MGNYISQNQYDVVLQAPNNTLNFDPRSPSVIFKRTPLRARQAARLSFADLADCRSPLANRTPIRRALFQDFVDPRSPALGRTPLRHLDDDAAAAPGDDNATPVKACRRRLRMSFDDDQDTGYDSALDRDDSELLSAFDDEQFELNSCLDEQDWMEPENEQQWLQTPTKQTPQKECSSKVAPLMYQINIRTPRAKLSRSSHVFDSPAKKVSSALSAAISSPLSTPTKMSGSLVHRSRITMHDRLVASCPNSPVAA